MKIFFDVDGVLIDGWHTSPERRKRWDADIHRDLGVDAQAFQERFFLPPPGRQDASLMQACAKGKLDLKVALAFILPSVGYHGSVDAFVAYWFEKDSNVNRDLLDIVRRLDSHARIDLYLVTGQEHHRADYLWNTLGFRDYFKDILYSARFGHLKSEPAFYEKIGGFLGIAPEERPIFFDDQDAVVRLARNAGWDAHIFDSIEVVLTHPVLRRLLANDPAA